MLSFNIYLLSYYGGVWQIQKIGLAKYKSGKLIGLLNQGSSW